MQRNGVVGLLVDAVGLVAADAEVGLLREKLDQRVADPPVPVGEDADVPGPRSSLAAEQRRAAVHGDEGGRLRARLPVGEHALDLPVVGFEDLAAARIRFARLKVLVAGDGGAVADGEDRLRIAGPTVAVDDQARIGLEHVGRVERPRESVSSRRRCRCRRRCGGRAPPRRGRAFRAPSGWRGRHGRTRRGSGSGRPGFRCRRARDPRPAEVCQ